MLLGGERGRRWSVDILVSRGSKVPLLDVNVNVLVSCDGNVGHCETSWRNSMEDPSRHFNSLSISF